MTKVDMSVIIDAAIIIIIIIIGLGELTNLRNVMATGVEVAFGMMIMAMVTTMRDGAHQGIENVSMRETVGVEAIIETRVPKGKSVARRAWAGASRREKGGRKDSYVRCVCKVQQWQCSIEKYD
jgi:hypothetical protein